MSVPPTLDLNSAIGFVVVAVGRSTNKAVASAAGTMLTSAYWVRVAAAKSPRIMGVVVLLLAMYSLSSSVSFSAAL